jgi:uncharacterized protein (DUF302 family)
MKILRATFLALAGCLGLLGGLLAPPPVGAEESLLMVRSSQGFPETMLALQESIKAHEYLVARVQRVDVGLSGAGFETDKYRIVFYGNTDEVRMLTAEHPELIPFLPLNFSIFAEAGQTLVVAMNPSYLGHYYQDAELQVLFARWESDVRSILSDVRKAGME